MAIPSSLISKDSDSHFSQPMSFWTPRADASPRQSASMLRAETLCRVCGDRASGRHYGVQSCDGCRGFFKSCTTRKKRSTANTANENDCFQWAVIAREILITCQISQQFQETCGLWSEATCEAIVEIAQSFYRRLFMDILEVVPSFNKSCNFNCQERREGRQERLTRCSSPVRPDALIYLSSLIRWLTIAPPFIHLTLHDRRVLIANSWHSLFLVNYSSQFARFCGGIRDDHVRTFVRSLNELKLNTFEIWCLNTLVAFRSECEGLENAFAVRTIHEQTLLLLANCETFSGATSFDYSKIRFGKIVLLIPALALISINVVMQSFFDDHSIEEIKRAYENFCI